MQSLEGKIVLVTGGRTGIGAATAKLFAEQGAAVAIGVHREGDGAETIAAIEQAGARGIAIPMDVSKASQVEAGIQTVIETLGGLDILVTNAGIEQPETTEISNISRSDANKVIDINLRGTWLCCQAAMPQIVERKGAICLVSSLWGTLGGAGLSAYSATKGGVHALTRSLAVEHGPNGVRVNCVAPGAINTPMLERVMEDDFPFDPQKNIPLQRPGEAEEVAEAIVWLCSPSARYVTGQVLGADGGITIKMSVCA